MFPVSQLPSSLPREGLYPPAERLRRSATAPRVKKNAERLMGLLQTRLTGLGTDTAYRKHSFYDFCKH